MEDFLWAIMECQALGEHPWGAEPDALQSLHQCINSLDPLSRQDRDNKEKEAQRSWVATPGPTAISSRFGIFLTQSCVLTPHSLPLNT